MATTAPGLRAAAALVNASFPASLGGVDGSSRTDFVLPRLSTPASAGRCASKSCRSNRGAGHCADRRIDVERVAAAACRSIGCQRRPRHRAPHRSASRSNSWCVRAASSELALGARGATPLVFRASTWPERWRTTGDRPRPHRREFERTRIAARVRIGALPPFPTRPRRGFERPRAWQNALWLPTSWRQPARCSELTLELRADDDAARAQATATLRVFDVVPLERTAWPTSTRSIRRSGSTTCRRCSCVHTCRLLPTDACRRTGGRCRGPFAVENSIAGPVDRESRAAPVGCSGTLDLGRRHDSRSTSTAPRACAARPAGADVVQLPRVSRCRRSSAASTRRRCTAARVATTCDRQVDYTLAEANSDSTAVPAMRADCRSAPTWSRRHCDQVLEIRPVGFGSGEGRADLRGRLEFGGAQALQLSGNFRQLDLAQTCARRRHATERDSRSPGTPAGTAHRTGPIRSGRQPRRRSPDHRPRTREPCRPTLRRRRRIAAPAMRD